MVANTLVVFSNRFRVGFVAHRLRQKAWNHLAVPQDVVGHQQTARTQTIDKFVETKSIDPICYASELLRRMAMPGAMSMRVLYGNRPSKVTPARVSIPVCDAVCGIRCNRRFCRRC